MILCSEEKRRELSRLFYNAYWVDCTNCQKEECISFRKKYHFPLERVWCPNITPKRYTLEIKRYKRLLKEWKLEKEELIRTVQLSNGAKTNE